MSGPDLSQLSDQILTGQSAIDHLPTDVRGQLINYWQTLGVNFAQQDVAKAQLGTLGGAGFQQQAAQQMKNPSFMQSAINVAFKPVSMLGSLSHSIYSGVVSPTLSSTFLGVHDMFYGYNGDPGSDNELSDLWTRAHAVSPGQAIWELGMNNDELKQRGIAPEQMVADKKAQEAGTFFAPQTAQNPWGTKSRSDLYFGSGWAQNTTGALDIASSWYLDPLSKVGKLGGLAKVAAYTKPVGKVFEAAAKGGGTPEEIGERLAQQPSIQAVSDRIMQIKNASAGTGATTYNLRTQIGTLKDSNAGDALASLLAQAKDQDEVNRIIRISIGDRTALGNTLAQGDMLAANVASLKLSVTNADAYVSRLQAAGLPPANPTMANAIASRDRFKSLLENNIQQQGMIQQARDAYASVENLNYNQTLTNAALAIRRGASQATGATANLLSKTVIGSHIVNTGNFAVKMLRTAGDIKPAGWIDVNDPTSWREVDASLKEVRGLPDDTRKSMVGAYLNANANQRGQILIGIERGAVNHMVDQYNLGKAPDDQINATKAGELFKDYQQRRSSTIQSISAGRTSYSSSPITGPSGMTVDADAYTNPSIFDFSNTGEALVASPVLETQLLNNHVMMDFGGMQKAINLHGSSWTNARDKIDSAFGTATSVTDTMNHYWKALQLLRPAYTPRALTDDFLGQVARFGSLAMGQRAIEGGKVAAQDLWLSRFRKDEAGTAKVEFGKTQQFIEELGQQEQSKITQLEGLTPGTPEHDAASNELDLIQSTLAQQREKSFGLSNVMAGGLGTRQVKIGRDIFSAPYGGTGGAMARDDIAGTRFAEMVNSDPANFYLRQMRQMGFTVMTNKDPEAQYLAALNRSLSRQVANSFPGRLALAGQDATQIAARLRSTTEGQQFMRDMALQHRTEDDMAQRVVAHVDGLLNPAVPATAPIREALLNGTYEPSMLKDIPEAARNPVSGELWDYAVGKSKVSQMIDSGISAAYRWMGDAPSNLLLRNPLFKQEYKASLARQLSNRQTQGITEVTQDDHALMEATARRQAIQQVKKYTYNMDHETKMQYWMRNMIAFLGPTAETWMRWGRIISDKPQVLGQVANAYNAPARAGVATDSNGNKVNADGYSIDPVTGQKTFVPVAARNMTIQVPSWLGGKALANFLGIENPSFKIPMSSAMMVMSEGDGPLPVGVGPIVTIPLNHFAQANPGLADWAQNVGLLPYGPQPDLATVTPGWLKKAVDAGDPSTASRQRALGYLMQAETMKYNAGLRTTRPTWDELQSKADKFAIARAVWSAVAPVSGDQADPYQFFRDDYKRMQQLDPSTADEKFLEKYGDSFYDFSESMSKNNSGLQPTQNSVKLSQQWRNLIDQTGGQYAGLIVGDPGDSGTYSNGAYYYEKSTPVAAGSTTTMRSDLSARDAWKQVNANRGWAEYDNALTTLNAQLIQRGLRSFSDRGAQDLAKIRKNVLSVLTEKYRADGSLNPQYNEDFANAYATMDTNKYNQTAQDLETIVNDPQMWAKAYDAKTNTVGQRSDIYSLKSYLAAREQVMQILAQRSGQGGSSDINANSNTDLRLAFEQNTNSLIEQDTKFQSLHTKYFANDMGYNTSTSPEILALLQAEAQGQTTSLAGQPALNIGEVGSLG